MGVMRITVNVPDDVYELARSVATARRMSLGEALADLVRGGFEQEPRLGNDSGFPCFAVSRRASPTTLDRTLAAEDEL